MVGFNYAYKGKSKATNEWVFGDLIHRKIWSNSVLVIRTEDNGFDNYVEHEIIPETLCRPFDDHDSLGNPIFDKDIIQFTTHGGNVFRYLLQWIDEGQEFQAMPIDDGDNILVLPCYLMNYTRSLSWNDFIPMLQNVYGDSKEIKVIGNFIDNPELIPVSGDYSDNTGYGEI